MLEYVLADFKRVYLKQHTPDVAYFVRCFFCNYGFHALLVYRFGQWLRCGQRHLTLWLFSTFGLGLYYILEALIRLLYDIHLDLSAKIGPGLYIGHFGGIDLRHCILGENCAIQQEVRVGLRGGESRGPQIGNHVWIGAHTQIHGPLRIGDGATIGAGSVVQQDVSPRCLVLGCPLRILKREFNNSPFL